LTTRVRPGAKPRRRDVGFAFAFLLATIAAAWACPNDCRAAEGRLDVLDPRALPLGDGKVSSEPKRGYVYSCTARFRGGGAQHTGDWIHGSTWDATRKIVVQGEVAWPDATLSMTTANGERRIRGNGLPTNHATGNFPVRPSDPAYAIDRNPNGIAPQQIALSLPAAPVPASVPECVPMGMIGILSSGVALFNALDAGGRDAAAHEVQDHCNGHPQRAGQYHYHGPTPCVSGVAANNALIGYALDGFGIYSMYDENGRELTNADLDECHGRVSRIPWDGREVVMYHYVLTREYPYSIGCFRGKPVKVRMQAEFAPLEQVGPGGPPNGPRGGGRQPPPEAVAACAGLSSGSACRFTSPHGNSIAGTCRTPAGALACVPDRR